MGVRVPGRDPPLPPPKAAGHSVQGRSPGRGAPPKGRGQLQGAGHGAQGAGTAPRGRGGAGAE